MPAINLQNASTEDLLKMALTMDPGRIKYYPLASWKLLAELMQAQEDLGDMEWDIADNAWEGAICNLPTILLEISGEVPAAGTRIAAKI